MITYHVWRTLTQNFKGLAPDKPVLLWRDLELIIFIHTSRHKRNSGCRIGVLTDHWNVLCKVSFYEVNHNDVFNFKYTVTPTEISFCYLSLNRPLDYNYYYGSQHLMLWIPYKDYIIDERATDFWEKEFKKSLKVLYLTKCAAALRVLLGQDKPSVCAQCPNESSPSTSVIPTHHPSIPSTRQIRLERVSSAGQYAAGSPISADE